MGIFKLKKNKKFDYTPRYYKGEGNPFEVKHKFDEHRKTIDNKGLKTKFVNAIDDYKSPDKSANKRIYIIIAILIFIFLLLIEFDLSIFLPNR
ncbi:MAG: riboflavin synthase subunit beta [Gelidibacter sp.]|nr:riboflavin synthase subunit beta [Gelidibacter sp.]